MAGWLVLVLANPQTRRQELRKSATPTATTDHQESIVRDTTQGALRLAMQITGCRAEAMDILQSAIVKSLEHRNAPRPEDAGFRPWFFRVVRNQSIDWLRAQRKFTGDGEVPDVPSDHGDPEASLEQERRKVVLHKALNSLNAEQREIICLKDFHDFSYLEIAEIMAIEKGTVMSRLHRARMALKDALAGLNLYPGDSDDQ
jgi:RNA polymerase sigma-70 factor (ECF subfamily)